MYTDSAANGIIPFKMSSASLSLDQFVEGWTLSDFMSESDSPPRTYERWISFESPFANVPLVQVGITGFDIDNRDSARMKVRAERITANGFMLVAETWGHTRVYSLEISWLALGYA